MKEIELTVNLLAPYENVETVLASDIFSAGQKKELVCRVSIEKLCGYLRDKYNADISRDEKRNLFKILSVFTYADRSSASPVRAPYIRADNGNIKITVEIKALAYQAGIFDFAAYFFRYAEERFYISFTKEEKADVISILLTCRFAEIC